MNHNVKLIAVTEPKIEGVSTAEELVAYMARVSNPTNQNNTKTAEKLLKYLMDHKHWSPFDMVDVVLEIECTRDIGRQILRHWSFRFQEFSQRYAIVGEDMFVQEFFPARLQDPKNRQNSITLNPELYDSDATVQTEWEDIQDRSIGNALESYNKAIDLGIAKELARKVLPEGLTMSRMYMKGSLRSWIFYCMVRLDPTTQKEHRDISADCCKIIVKEFPSLAGIFSSFDINELDEIELKA